MFFFNNVHLWNQAECFSELRIMKRRISVNDDDCRYLRNCSRLWNSDLEICWIKYWILLSHICSSCSCHNTLSITSCWLSSYSCRRLSINCSSIRICWICTSDNCRSKDLHNSFHYIWKQAESIQFSMIQNSTIDWICLKNNLICLLQNMLQFQTLH